MIETRGYVYADHLATTPVAEEVIEAMDKVGRFEYSGHSKEIVVKAWEEMRSDNSTDALVLER